MTGMKYHRLRQHRTQEELARRVRLSRVRIAQMEQGEPNGSYEHYEMVARALGVPVDELFGQHKDKEKSLRGHDVKLHAQENPYNSISHYRIERGLSFHALSEILYCTVEAAKAACMAEEAPAKHVEVLARRENLTPDAFRFLYKEGELL